jgi:hypothetical protein
MTLQLKDIPDHHDAEIVMKLYELRREAVMRESRAALFKDFWPTTLDEAMAPIAQTHPLNAAWRQVTSYWEMAYGMVKHGVLHGDFMLETGGAEGIVLLARVTPHLAAMREKSSPRLLINTEWMAGHTEFSRGTLARFEKAFAGALAARAAKK